MSDAPVAPFRIGVDVGGTFTDLVLIDAQGSVRVFKSPSNPADPSAAVLRAVDVAASSLGWDAATLLRGTEHFIHGSTIATNTLLERKGAKVGLLTTEGFRDCLEIRRGIREDVWDHRAPFPDVLVPRYLRQTVSERISADGEILQPIDLASVDSALCVFREEGVEAIAIALLHSYVNSAHEDAIASQIREAMPDVWLTSSSTVSPTIGEYERTSTVVLNAYVMPRVVPYLERLSSRLSELGLKTGLLLIQSNGGAISVPEVRKGAVRLVLSGPAAAIGSLRFFQRDIGSSDLMSIEVGGTSCDVALMSGGRVEMTDQLQIDGYSLAIPAVEIHTVGAGGGTIASVDGEGLLRAGPEGAGAVPGPAAYGFGGNRPTVTDAQLVLGRLKSGSYANGSINLDLNLALRAIEEHVAIPLGISPTAAAAGLIRLVEQNMIHAVERVSLERGHNPSRFVLVAAGGAGPLHGASVGRAIGCRAVYVPRLAGVFCAFGMCNSDVRHDYVRSWSRDLDPAGSEASDDREKALADLDAVGLSVLGREGFGRDSLQCSRGYDLRYRGQQWTVPVNCESSNGQDIRAEFETEYQRLFGYIQPEGEIEVVNLRLAATAQLPQLNLQSVAKAAADPAPSGSRDLWIDEQSGVASVPVYEGADLLPGHTLVGPAIINEPTTTIFVGRGDRLEVTSANNYLIHL